MPPFFLYLLKIYHMKLINYLLIALVFVSSCKEEDTVETPVLPSDYGKGMYIATENGVSFYDGEVVKNQIFKGVNGTSISSVSKIKFKGTKAYIAAGNQIVTANIETFENKDVVNGFVDVVDFDFVNFDRLFVVDKGDAKVKVVDLNNLDITAEVETGENTVPTFIASSWYRSIVLNSGAVADSLKDTTIVAIDYRDGVIPLSDFMGSIEVGDNPNSVVWISNLKVLCKGIYDPNHSSSNTESSLSKIDPWDMELDWNITLSNIYNAQNLVSDVSDSKYFFTAINGVYQMNNDGTSISQKINFTSDILETSIESYAVNDTTIGYANMLFVNDAIGANNTIYKYNLATSTFCDTIIVDSPVKDINFY